MSSKCVVRPNGTVLHAASPSKRLFVRLPLAGDRLFADVRRFANKKDSLPKTPQEVISYARRAFEQESRKPKADLMRACLLVALEEEAAFRRHQDAVLNRFVSHSQQLARDLERSSRSLWSAGSSSFGPEPLDCLADQALLVFAHALHCTALVRQSQRLKCPLCELPEMVGLLREHCGLFLHTTAEFLFQMQGYRRESRAGVPASFLISAAIDRGRGSAVTMTLLFREVCRRAGLKVAVAAMAGGTFFVVWPEAVAGVDLNSAAQSLSVRGHRLVMDVNKGGATLLASEVEEAFQLRRLEASSRSDMLYSLLIGLAEAQWASALDVQSSVCRESIAQVVKRALDPRTHVEDPFMLQRAIACIERCLHLKPYHAEVHLCSAALHYFARNFERARRHLNVVLEALGRSAVHSPGGHLPKRRCSVSGESDQGMEQRSWGGLPSHSGDTQPTWGGQEGSSTGDTEEEYQLRGRRGRWSKRSTPSVRPTTSPWQIFVAEGGVQKDLLQGVGRGCLTLETRKAVVAATASRSAGRQRRVRERQRILEAEKRELTLLRRPVWPAGSGGNAGGKGGPGGAPPNGAGPVKPRAPPPRIRMTLHAPLQLDKSLFSEEVIADVRLFSHKMALLRLAGSPNW